MPLRMGYDADFYPYGGERPYTTTCNQNYKFTGYERDAESVLSNGEANDYAMARHLSTRLGRFLSSDPLVFGDIGDPQTLNRYSYVRNNPTNMVDPSGLCSEDDEYDDCFPIDIGICIPYGDEAEVLLSPRPILRLRPLDQ
jgi:RHS repeat-associated protein